MNRRTDSGLSWSTADIVELRARVGFDGFGASLTSDR